MNDITYPKNVNVQGLMSFPLYSVENIAQLKENRVKKNQSNPRYPDRIGFTLLLNQQQHDRIVKELTDVYLPFAAGLKAETKGAKGIDPKLVAKLAALVKAQDWSESNLPLRDLNDKDVENLEKNKIEGIVSKLRVAGPPQDGAISVKAMIREDEEEGSSMIVVPISSVADRLGEQADPNALWFGALWPFKTNLRFNAYSAANFGVTAYVRAAYLQADKELTMFSGGNDASVLEDGDDWED